MDKTSKVYSVELLGGKYDKTFPISMRLSNDEHGGVYFPHYILVTSKPTCLELDAFAFLFAPFELLRDKREYVYQYTEHTAYKVTYVRPKLAWLINKAGLTKLYV